MTWTRGKVIGAVCGVIIAMIGFTIVGYVVGKAHGYKGYGVRMERSRDNDRTSQGADRAQHMQKMRDNRLDRGMMMPENQGARNVINAPSDPAVQK